MRDRNTYLSLGLLLVERADETRERMCVCVCNQKREIDGRERGRGFLFRISQLGNVQRMCYGLVLFSSSSLVGRMNIGEVQSNNGNQHLCSVSNGEPEQHPMKEKKESKRTQFICVWSSHLHIYICIYQCNNDLNISISPHLYHCKQVSFKSFSHFYAISLPPILWRKGEKREEVRLATPRKEWEREERQVLRGERAL